MWVVNDFVESRYLTFTNMTLAYSESQRKETSVLAHVSNNHFGWDWVEEKIKEAAHLLEKEIGQMSLLVVFI